MKSLNKDKAKDPKYSQAGIHADTLTHMQQVVIFSTGTRAGGGEGGRMCKHWNGVRHYGVDY